MILKFPAHMTFSKVRAHDTSVILIYVVWRYDLWKVRKSHFSGRMPKCYAFSKAPKETFSHILNRFLLFLWVSASSSLILCKKIYHFLCKNLLYSGEPGLSFFSRYRQLPCVEQKLREIDKNGLIQSCSE